MYELQLLQDYNILQELKIHNFLYTLFIMSNCGILGVQHVNLYYIASARLKGEILFAQMYYSLAVHE